MRDLLQVEQLILPSPSSLSIQNFCDLAITVKIQQPVDLGHHFRLRLSNLCDRQWLGENQTSCGATAEAHMDPDHFPVDQRYILDEQTQDAFSLAGFDARIIPDTRKVSRQGEQLLLCLGVNQQTLLLYLLFILFLRLGQGSELAIPFRFQAIGDKTIIRINLHVATASELSLVLCSLNVLAPQGVGFGYPCLNFLLNCEGDL